MKIKKLILPNTFIIEPKVFYDKRGFLYEIWSQDLYFKNKIKFKIVQVLHSYSKKILYEGFIFNIQTYKEGLYRLLMEKYLMSSLIFEKTVQLLENGVDAL
tara:strand:+ start:329 stop:631 length:303 start_codon:yes stop_codon:yes gene_type:complete